MSAILATAEGEAQLAKRLAMLDAMRGLFSTLVLDMTEDYLTDPTPPALNEIAGISKII